MKKIGAILFVFLFISTCYDNFSVVFSENTGADYLIEIGKEHLNRGEVEWAIHEFSKALMIEPENQEALKELEKLGVQERLYPGIKTRLTEQGQWARRFQDYNAKMADLEQSKEDLESRFDRLQKERDHLAQTDANNRQQIASLKDEIAQAESYVNELKKQYERLNNQLKDVGEESEGLAIHKRGELVDQAIVLEEKDRDLSSLRSRLQEVTNRSLKYENEMTTLADKYNAMREEMALLKLQRDQIFEVMDDYLYVRRNEMNELGDQVIYKEMDLAHNQAMLADKLDELVEMHVEADEHRQQIQRRDEWINEKENRIQFLEGALYDAHGQIENLLEEKVTN